MVRTNKFQNERNSVQRSSQNNSLSNYRIPRLSQQQQVEPDYQESNRSGHSSRSRSRDNRDRRPRRTSRSPRRPARDVSIQRNRQRLDLRNQLNEHQRANIRVSFRPHVEQIPIAERLGPNPLDNELVRPVTRRRTNVLKFHSIPIEVKLIDFLNALSRFMRGITGATREFNYNDQVAGTVIYVYAISPEEVDAAVGRGLPFDFPTGRQTIHPILMATVITSVKNEFIRNENLQKIPTLMVRQLDQVTARHAISITTDAAQIVTEAGAYVTHVRVPAKDFTLSRMAGIAFVGISSQQQAETLQNHVHERCAKIIPFALSDQHPVLIPTSLAQQQQDATWHRRAATRNMLIYRANPFDRA